jgi:hypothetical protein
VGGEKSLIEVAVATVDDCQRKGRFLTSDVKHSSE